MFIQKYEQEDSVYLLTIQTRDKTILTAAKYNNEGALLYDKISIDGSLPIESSGWFQIDESLLLWGHDAAVGDFDKATVFSKVE